MILREYIAGICSVGKETWGLVSPNMYKMGI
jgi:hypothetical protein